MRSGLPSDHGLPERVLLNAQLLPSDQDGPLLTDVQHESLAQGLLRNVSLLVSAPTSTGKTLIGLWSIAKAVEDGNRAVYLVSHRALAKQKFQEIKEIFLTDYLDNDASCIVCATGEGVEDASGRKTSSPLSSRILVATYEKFLGCLSVGGPPRDLRDITFGLPPEKWSSLRYGFEPCGGCFHATEEAYG